MAYGQNMNAPMSGLTGLAAMKGRQGDNTLVHVNPMELKALEAMAPGGLTRNPYTGLPEAFKLKDILPVLGAVAGAAFLGPAVGVAFGTGLGAAGGGLAAGQSIEEAALTGLTSGVTAGMFAPAAAATTGAATGATTGAATGAATGAGTEALSNFVPGEVTKTGAAGIFKPIPPSAFSSGTAGAAGTSSFADIASAQAAGALQPATMGQLAGAAGRTGLQALKDQGLKSVAGGALAAGAASPVEMVKPSYGPVEAIQNPQESANVSRAEIDKYIRGGGQMPQFFRPTRMAAQGGPIGYGPFGAMQYPQQVGQSKDDNGNTIVNVNPSSGASMNYNEGGPISLNVGGQPSGMFSGMVDGRLGDGMSDNVAFEVVGDPQIERAQLSPDEYVMDAYTVSALGNGSSDAGAKRLDDFRTALREKAMGRKSQPKQINGAKELSRMV